MRKRQREDGSASAVAASPLTIGASKANDHLSRLAALVAKSKRIVVVCGAGISTEAGLADFRSPSGLYNINVGDLPAELLFDIEVLRDDPSFFYKFANVHLFPALERAEPTETHRFLVALERRGKLALAVTQNIDGLELKAGLPRSKLLAVHGQATSAHCESCGYVAASGGAGVAGVPAGDGAWWNKAQDSGLPHCPGGHVLRPDILFFGEAVGKRDMARLDRECRSADLLLVLGSSMSVQPVSNVVFMTGEKTVKAFVSLTLPLAHRDAFDVCVVGWTCDDAVRALAKAAGI